MSLWIASATTDHLTSFAVLLGSSTEDFACGNRVLWLLSVSFIAVAIGENHSFIFCVITNKHTFESFPVLASIVSTVIYIQGKKKYKKQMQLLQTRVSRSSTMLVWKLSLSSLSRLSSLVSSLFHFSSLLSTFPFLFSSVFFILKKNSSYWDFCYFVSPAELTGTKTCIANTTMELNWIIAIDNQ